MRGLLLTLFFLLFALAGTGGCTSRSDTPKPNLGADKQPEQVNDGNTTPISRHARLQDERLIGTWQSDAERTVAVMREQGRLNNKHSAALCKMFGKLRVTYTRTGITSELDGVTEVSRYEVLGRDKLSVVIREVESKPSPLELTEFAVIHFEGPDSYWLYTKIGGIQEFFKRVREPLGTKHAEQPAAGDRPRE